MANGHKQRNKKRMMLKTFNYPFVNSGKGNKMRRDNATFGTADNKLNE